ncbi:PulJ/GspJ family protein [Vallicoccus soli]|uniref:Uncharacterized protein n=1 Tax=Vallicoccus soli TaxID=2339232 RepID=A0A3A3ZL23_9ACTN|nr:hypothetical protein [Vallicoccus soli]RJK96772.1 hypothetical protein D5H78_05730 [Vallicoccus soli]
MRTARRSARDDEGFALLSVIVTMALLTLFVLASVAYAANAVHGSRRGQDWHAALAAAQTGMDDLRSRLNDCDGYWSAPCPGGPDQSDLTTDWSNPTWQTVPSAAGETDRQFAYGFVTLPTQVTGLIRIRAMGRVVRGEGSYGPTRTLSADLRKPQFLNYVYYTDKESPSPRTIAALRPPRKVRLDPTYSTGGRTYTDMAYAGVTSAEADKCGRYYYSVPPATGARSSSYTESFTYSNATQTSAVTTTNAGGCDIQFGGGDTIDGPLYSKDALLVSGSPLFKGETSTYWQTSYSPAAPATAPYRKATTSSAPSSAGRSIGITDRSVDLPPTNVALRDKADPAKTSGGCLYTGPTSIELLPDGTMRVLSPMTTAATPACGGDLRTEQVVPLPSNGVVYVDAGTGACPAGKVLGRYPLDGEVVPADDYGCTAGDAYVKGTLDGRLTIGTAGTIYAVGNIRYEEGTSGGDVLGLVAQGYVKVWHPVRCDFVPEPGYYCQKARNADNRFDNLLSQADSVVEVDAAIISVDNSFIVQNYDKGEPITGKLRVVGGIYQRYRGTVGTGQGTTGYLKDYVYDTRLKSLPPPYFLEPTKAPWEVVGFSED